MKKFLTIEKKPTCDEYIVRGKGGPIGQLAKGEIFKKRIVMHIDGGYHGGETEWTSECLRQVADKLDELEGK